MPNWLTSTQYVDDFFPEDRSRACYGFYSPAVDRMIFVDSKDLFLSLQAATLFSSRMLLLVIAFDPTKHPIGNSTCYHWAPQHKIPQAAYHLPQIFPTVRNLRTLEYRGGSPHVSQDEILKAQENLGFVVQAAYALYLSESINNVNDPGAYEAFFPELQPFNTPDRRDFREIEEILYHFDSIDRASQEIDAILSGRLDELSRRRYYTRFNYLLYGQSIPPFR